MKSRQSRKLLALTAMICVSSAFTNGGEDNEWENRICRVMKGAAGMQPMLPCDKMLPYDKEQRENNRVLKHLSSWGRNNNYINYSFGEKSKDSTRRILALPDENYCKTNGTSVDNKIMPLALPYENSKASVNDMPKISTSKRRKNKKLSLDYLMRSASLKDNRVLNSADKKFYNEKYNEFRSAFFQLIQTFETKDPSQISGDDDVVPVMKTMRDAVDAVGLCMPITLRHDSEIFVPLNLYEFEKENGRYSLCSKEVTCNDGCFLYAKFIIPEDLIEKFSDIRISSIDKIDYRSPCFVYAKFTLISSDGSKECRNLVGELKGDIMIDYYTWFDLPEEQKTRYNLVCYSKMK